MTTAGTEEEAVRFLARHFLSLTRQDRTPENGCSDVLRWPTTRQGPIRRGSRDSMWR